MLVALAMSAALVSPLARYLDLPAWDLLSTIAPPRPAADVVVVAIDEPAFAEIGQRWPWPRGLHGRLVGALRDVGAKAIALDMIFAEPSAQQEDAALVRAMSRDVTLAADQTAIEGPQASQTIRVDPLPALLDAGARSGIAAISLDADGRLRRAPSFPDSLAAETLRSLGVEPGEARGLLQFRGGPRTYSTVSYYQALDPAHFLPPGFFKGKTVFVGLSLQSAANAQSGAADAFATPFTAMDGRLLSGVEAQATMFDAIRAGDLVRPMPLLAQIAAVAAAALIGAGLSRGGAVSWRAGATAATLAAAFVAASWFALENAALWLSPLPAALALLLTVAADAGVDYARERRARREISRAFGQYLPPEIVARLARDPSALKLGGERRTLTILFADVRGFTTLAERMKDDPERLTSLVNRLLGPLSDAVLAEGGTIDKYIGDCVMAFWNAPLDAPDHADRAIAAGLRMLDAVKRLNAELLADAGPAVTPLEIAIGVGINTGDCVVGNLGSDRRFDYTAVGDAVNLASRLEGASRLYGVPLLIGAETARRVAMPLIELDRIAVKGRIDGEPVFTILVGAAATEAQSRFIEAYRARDWDCAEQALAEAATEPALAVYALRMSERVAALRASPPAADWNGVFAATTK
jgi:adenylate cyclase